MSEPKSIGEILADYFTNSQELFAVEFRKHFATNRQLNPLSKTSTQQPEKLDDWIDNQDVMHILHISPRTLQTLRSNGTLPYSRIKGKFYYKATDVKELLEKNYSRNSKNRYPYGN